jgi:hypothetical protein
MKFTVYRDKWIRGEDNPKLLTVDDRRCCLGFLAKDFGYSDSEIKDRSCLEDLCDLTKLPYGLVEEQCSDYWRDSLSVKEIMSINDNKNISCSNRESKLKELFNLINIQIIFE